MDLGFLFIIAILILSIILHEVAHGYAANWLGDPTARLAGRLTINPVPHIDPVGSILLPGVLALTNAGFLFGWAKPVPYNPYNLSNQRWGEAIVAGAGPATNLLIALVFGLIIRFASELPVGPEFLEISASVVFINIMLALFNMIPVPPLDGSKILPAILPSALAEGYRELSEKFMQFGFVATILFLVIFIQILAAPFSALVRTVFTLITGAEF